ncbi:MAG: hypothetical protein Ta2A_05460 [Treponemataceae bacterium]|nr:MAG: hypothetical protein Ta2A_05460 [Treponemataceae bacterium]
MSIYYEHIIDETAGLFRFLAKRVALWTLAACIAAFCVAFFVPYFQHIADGKAKILMPAGLVFGAVLSFLRMRINKNTLLFVTQLAGKSEKSGTFFAVATQIGSIAVLFFVLALCLKKSLLLFFCAICGMLILPLVIIVYRKRFDALC